MKFASDNNINFSSISVTDWNLAKGRIVLQLLLGVACATVTNVFAARYKLYQLKLKEHFRLKKERQIFLSFVLIILDLKLPR